MESPDQSFELLHRRRIAGVEEYPAPVADVGSLLDSAERAGLRSGRAMRLRARASRASCHRLTSTSMWTTQRT